MSNLFFKYSQNLSDPIATHLMTTARDGEVGNRPSCFFFSGEVGLSEMVDYRRDESIINHGLKSDLTLQRTSSFYLDLSLVAGGDVR